MKLLFVSLLIIVSVMSYSQRTVTERVKLTPVWKEGKGFIPAHLRFQLYDTIIKIPSISFRDYAVFSLDFNDEQTFFYNYDRGLIPDSIYSLIINDRRYIRSDVNLNCDQRALILIGISYDGYLNIIPDLNNNNDFSDDTVFEYEKTDGDNISLSCLFNFVNIELYYKGEYKRMCIPLNLSFDISAKDLKRSNVTGM